MAKWRVLAVGGYPEESVKEALEAAFKMIFISALGDEGVGLVEEIRAPYKLGSLLKLVCHNSRSMWEVVLKLCAGSSSEDSLDVLSRIFCPYSSFLCV